MGNEGQWRPITAIGALTDSKKSERPYRRFERELVASDRPSLASESIVGMAYVDSPSAQPLVIEMRVLGDVFDPPDTPINAEVPAFVAAVHLDCTALPVSFQIADKGTLQRDLEFRRLQRVVADRDAMKMWLAARLA